MAVLIPGKNDLKTIYPEIAKEADGWDPSNFFPKSSKKKNWKCAYGHTWEIRISKRTINDTGCPYCNNRKLLSGFNDLETVFPEIAQEADGWDPSKVSAIKNEKLPWICKRGHSWETTINKRTTRGDGCPYCANQKLLQGFNDLKTRFPKIAQQANGWNPSKVIFGSGKKLPWICDKNHTWETPVSARIRRDSDCRFCINKEVWSGFNDIKTKFPRIAKQADGWDPSNFVFGSHQKKSWKCKYGHTWEAEIRSRTLKDYGCPICANRSVWKGFNDLETKFPLIAQEADGWDPKEVLYGSNQKKSWKCKHGHSWDTTVSHRTQKNSDCPVCTNRKLIKGFNDLETKFPEIADEANGWDPTEVLYGSNQKKSWKCKHGHTWEASLSTRTLRESGCPFCTNRKTLYGFNDLETKYPEIAKEADGWDPKEVLYGSNQKKSWKCKHGHTWETQIQHRTQNGSNCPVCTNRYVWQGFNDLETKFPLIAQEADGWDPKRVLFGTHEFKPWRCEHGHTWETKVVTRTKENGSNCPFCAGQKVWVGFNDLETKFPEVAEQADGWDPKNYVYGSQLKMPWKCSKGHTWEAIISSRSLCGNGCPYCGNKLTSVGFNDLETRFPEIAKEADGWDPKNYVYGSNQKKSWKCKHGHSWEATIHQRTAVGTGCPTCSNKKLWKGFNDLQTVFPEIAKEADGWDPSSILFGSADSMPWICDKGHKWETQISSRIYYDTKCPFCSNREVWRGFNDLQTVFPEIAKEADGWDPSNFIHGSHKKMPWICDKGHKWETVIKNRTLNNTGCPECAESGFKTGKDAWFYLMQRPGEFQIGITNNINQRIRLHKSFGWQEIEIKGPNSGTEVFDTEKQLKQWLKKKIKCIPGTHENWYASKLVVKSLKELKSISGITTNIF